MSKIVFFCIPAYGHTNPTLGVVRELAARAVFVDRHKRLAAGVFCFLGGNARAVFHHAR